MNRKEKYLLIHGWVQIKCSGWPDVWKHQRNNNISYSFDYAWVDQMNFENKPIYWKPDWFIYLLLQIKLACQQKISIITNYIKRIKNEF